MKNLLLLLLLLVCFSCNDSADIRLSEALRLIEINPSAALRKLDSIHNPEKLGRDHYMDYILAKTEARYLVGMDVANDTLIFDAEKYFENKPESAKACFYAGIVDRQRNIPDRAIDAFLRAERFAEKSNDKYILARSNQMIANLYLVREIMDIAVPRYKKALEYYKDIPDVDKYKLQTLKYLGVAYKEKGVLDSASYYYNDGLRLAEEINDTFFQADILQSLGVLYREDKKYMQAMDFFRKTFTFGLNTGDSLRLYLNIAKVFNETNQVDSARYYTGLIKDRLSHIDDNYVLASMYGVLASYNEKAGDFRDALAYTQKQNAVKDKIAEVNNDLKFLTAEKRFKHSLQEKNEENLRMKFYILLVIVIAVIIIGLLFIRKKQNEKQLLGKEKLLLEKENELLGLEKAAMEKMIENLSFIKDLQQDFITKWANIEKQVKKLAIKYEATEEPPLYVRIKQMIEEAKAKTADYLIERARTIILKYPKGQAALDSLTKKDLLVIMLCYLRFNSQSISAMLGLVANKKHIECKKFYVSNKLVWAGFSEEEAKRIVFPDGYEVK